ncbi:MAG: hypothetical protein WBZ45_00630 [Acidimicrobiia bacterium]
MIESLETLVDLLTRPEFLTGLILGCLALGLLYLVTSQGIQSGWWGLSVAAAAGLIIELIGTRRLTVVAGWALLALGGWLFDREDQNSILGWIPIGIGAVVISWRGGFHSAWVILATPIAIVAVGYALTMWSKRLPHTLIGPMFAVTAFGIWVTVPETELARILLGVSLPLALATLKPISARISAAGAFALAGVVAWLVATGGEARGASIIGGWASMGAMALLPFLAPGARGLVERRPWLVFGLHAALVFIGARVIGLWTAPGWALLAVAAVGALAYFGLSLLLSQETDAPVG